LKRPTGRLRRLKRRESRWIAKQCTEQSGVKPDQKQNFGGARYGWNRCARSASGSSSELEEVTLNWNKWVRQTHRWLSIAFTVAVIVNGVAVVQMKYSSRLGLLAVIPLALQFFTGPYLFVLPYAAKWGSGRRTD
jgi:hypothetical protein